jgi:uncharacterized protein YehS (DUF1456 family)
MNNNDVLRRLRYIFDLGDDKMMRIFSLGGASVSRADLSDLLKKDEDPAFLPCSDRGLAFFLNGLIVHRRGQKEDGSIPPVEDRLDNNTIFRKLKIALELKSEDILDIMELAEFRISEHELTAFFRRPDHRQYRRCQDQILRYFLKGLQVKYRSA